MLKLFTILSLLQPVPLTALPLTAAAHVGDIGQRAVRRWPTDKLRDRCAFPAPAGISPARQGVPATPAR